MRPSALAAQTTRNATMLHGRSVTSMVVDGILSTRNAGWTRHLPMIVIKDDTLDPIEGGWRWVSFEVCEPCWLGHGRIVSVEAWSHDHWCSPRHDCSPRYDFTRPPWSYYVR